MLKIHTTRVAEHELTVVLPTNYDEEKKYRTIYLQDGGNGAKQVLNYIDHLTITMELEPLIFVGINPVERNEEYTPWPSNSLLNEQHTYGGKAKTYLNQLVNEIKPFIDKHFATNPAAEYTAIGGCSFGGLVSLFASYYYPDVFSDYIILSASFWYKNVIPYVQGERIQLKTESVKKPVVNRTNHRLYLYVGELEGVHRNSVQKEMVPYTYSAYDSFMKEGFPTDQLFFETDLEGTHDVYFFSRYLLRALRWLYPMI